MKHKIKTGELIVSLIIPLAVGALAAWLIRDSVSIFAAVRKPPLSPPSWLFPPVWTLLYILMGIASYLIYTSPASLPRRQRALTVYALSLGVNFFWPILFFNMQLYLFSFIWLLLLAVLVVLCCVLYHYIAPKAGKLLLPYLLWLSYAAYLNLGVYLLNP